MWLIYSADLLSLRFVFISFVKKRSGCRNTSEEVHKYHIPNFSNWKSLRTTTNATFETALARPEKDLRTSLR